MQATPAPSLAARSLPTEKWKRILFPTVSVLLALLLPLLALEGILRLLLVSTGMRMMPVNAQNPVMHFQPNLPLAFSRGWNFSIVNHGRVNNAGYVNGQTYDSLARSPLLAVIGDSYVEAAMVPYLATLQVVSRRRSADEAGYTASESPGLC